MAVIYRKKSPKTGKELPFYYASFRVPSPSGNLKQIHRSTKSQDRREAKRIAHELEADFHREKDAEVSEYNRFVLGKIRQAGEEAMKGRLNASKAKEIISQILIAGGEDAPLDYTVRAWFEEWEREKKQTTSKATALFYSSITRDFISFMGKRADKNLEAVSTKDIQDFRDKVRSAGRTAKTCNHKVKAVRSVFREAVKRGVLLRNPADPVSSLDESDSVERLPFEVGEVRQLLEASPSHEWEGVILLGVFTGLRLRDITRLKAGNVDLKRKVIQVMPSKTKRKKKVVEIPLHSQLVDYFQRHPLSPFDGADVFPSLSSTGSGGTGGLSAQFKEIMNTAKVSRNVTRRREDGAARTTAHRSFHSLRHTFTTWLASANVPEDVRMKMTGHTETSTHQKYTHHELETLREGVERLGGI